MDLPGAYSVAILAVLCSAIMRPFAAAQNGGPLAVRIACGSTADSIANETGYVWSKDFGFSGGKGAPTKAVNGIATHLNSLRYFDSLDGPQNCYNISVPSGHYLTRFFFTFGETDNAGQEPVFELSLEGTLVYSLAPGWSSYDDNHYGDSLLHITDGSATVCFHRSSHGNPAIGSIEILQLYVDAYNLGSSANLNVIMRTIKRVTAGAAESGYGSRMHADAWGGDRYWATDRTLFAPGSPTTMLHTNANISNFGNPPNIYPEAIYQTATTTGPLSILSYSISVPSNQNYSIWLHFAEIEPGVIAPGMRVFDVKVNDDYLFHAVDIVKMAGAPFRALILNKTIPVASNTLKLSFIPLVGSVSVNAFEVFQIIPREYATLDDNVWALQAIKQSQDLPTRLGWNGDPCVPPVHPWIGVKCSFESVVGAWFVSSLALDQQGVRGQLGDGWVGLNHLQSLNLSNNILDGVIPSSFGNLTILTSLDLSHNRLNGQIPASLGQLSNLKQLLLNDNLLSGEVPPELGALPIRGAVLNVANNPDLCGVGIRSCTKAYVKLGLMISLVVGLCVLAAGIIFLWRKRKANSRGAQRLPRDAPYAKARTTFVRDVQMARNVLQNHFSRPAPAYTEATPLNPY
ncbi:receptor-like protein 4 [Physcomitrium patens]|uniref:Malectin-like domain-containing protein n=1 Tax=Physcomitrium patens TaxID=3218 RepID=A0A7I4AJY4_PHYPA|nr:receptor like protein 4-like [Physcomitrium patens]XP_024392180.1 receptor like protein 4-like [Physcomitrium patens]|eukprot:XP_024392179.1 receptor like protein 4-like [Physcomitrella patens]